MKKLFATILSLVVLVGCTQNDADNTVVHTYNEDLFYGSFEDVNTTRTYVDKTMTMLWHADDRISLFRSTLNEEFKFAGETGDSAGSFEEIPSDIFVTGAEISTNYGVYPYNSATTIGDDESISLTMPSVQTYAQNTFGRGANTAVAATESSSSRFLPFRNVGGFLVVKIYSPSGVVKSVELKGNNGEVLAGEATVKAKYGYLPLLTMGDGTDSITLDCGGGVEVGTTEDSATHFWFVVPPTTFELGFTVSVTDTAGAVTTKSTTKRNVISRNEVTIMSAFEIVETEKMPTKSVIWYTNGSTTEPTAPNNPAAFGDATIQSNTYDAEKECWVITFDKDVTEIGDSAFSYCDSLTSVTIGDSVTEIGRSAFSYCDSLTSVTIGDSVTEIGRSAFWGCDSLTSVTIPDSVTEIGRSAFSSCISLTSVTIGDSVTTIGNEAFSSCISLTSVTIPDSVSSIGDYAFYECDSLTSVTIGNSVTTIGERAFYECESLTSVTIGDSVTTIGNEAFSSCDSLTSVTIPDSVTTIGESAFAYCDSLKEFKGKFAADGGRCLIMDNTIIAYAEASGTTYAIPDSVTTIGEDAFYECRSLTSVTIPDSVTTIGEESFYECRSLTSVNIPDSVTTIGGGAFWGCSSLTSVTIPNSVKTIGDYAFRNCFSLTSVTIPDSVTAIGNWAFAYCYSLTSVTIPDSVTTIGEGAFSSCYSLTSVTIPDGVTTIGKAAFWCCDSLTSVTIPDNVTMIGDNAFEYCTCLATVYCKPTTPPIGGWMMFSSNAAGRKIYVPTASVEAYKSAAYWSNYKNYIVGYDF